MDIIAQERAPENMAHWKQEIDAIMKVCNDANMPTTKGNTPLTLSERVAWMAALLASYRTTPLKPWVEGTL